MKVRIAGTHLCLTKASATHQCLINETRKEGNRQTPQKQKQQAQDLVLPPQPKKKKVKKEAKVKGVAWEGKELCHVYFSA